MLWLEEWGTFVQINVFSFLLLCKNSLRSSMNIETLCTSMQLYSVAGMCPFLPNDAIDTDIIRSLITTHKSFAYVQFVLIVVDTNVIWVVWFSPLYVTMNLWWRHQWKTHSALLARCVGNSPVTGEFPHKSQWRGALIFPLICTRTNGWVYNRDTGDLRRYHAHYGVTVMTQTLLDKCSVCCVWLHTMTMAINR